MSVPARAYLSIGEVLGKLRGEFPDVTISKIRFLESEGLIEPQRTPSGYRKFTNTDLDRLRYVLLAQRDQYLPLKVIKDNLDALDRGLTPAATGNAAPTPRLATVDGAIAPSSFVESSELRLSREELLSNSGLKDEQLVELEGYGLIQIKGRFYDGDALTVAKVVAEIASFGIEGRHLRAFKTAADREVGLVEQVITPLLRQKSPEAKARAEEVSRELASLSVRLHAALVRSGIHRAR
ncbi:MAG: MerR family transcriptional regulator [Actinobacteria bacterium]|jgi:DNA-binding transcriptional MerR regulator|nr:MerR family transcriptional regulator [Actinomycetota bacterium]